MLPRRHRRRHASPGYEDLGDRAEQYFRVVCGRRCNALNTRYLLPADEDELTVSWWGVTRKCPLLPVTMVMRRDGEPFWLPYLSFFCPRVRGYLLIYSSIVAYGIPPSLGPVHFCRQELCWTGERGPPRTQSIQTPYLGPGNRWRFMVSCVAGEAMRSLGFLNILAQGI
jgi:hypothetical protein